MKPALIAVGQGAVPLGVMSATIDVCSYRKRRRAESSASEDSTSPQERCQPDAIGVSSGVPLRETPGPGLLSTGEAAPSDDANSQAEVGQPHPRLAHLPLVRMVADGLLPPELCSELAFALKATSSVGYRPHVRSATIHDIAATAPWLMPSLARARQAVLGAVEAAFGLSLELAVEFSGLISWTGGAELGWHHDANREYLSRRHLSAVLYLNNQGTDFGAGDFRFKDGPEPLRVVPMAGRLVAYTADRRNVHCVERVAWGERCTLTMWFSLDPGAAEDEKVLQQLSSNARLLQPPPPPPSTSATAIAAGKYSEPWINPQPQQSCGGGGHHPALSAPGGDLASEPSNADTHPSPAPAPATASPTATPATAVAPALAVAATSPPAHAEAGGSGCAALHGRTLWWSCLGPGLPHTMYQLPPAREGGAGGGDLRRERLWELGLYLVRRSCEDRVPTTTSAAAAVATTAEVFASEAAGGAEGAEELGTGRAPEGQEAVDSGWTGFRGGEAVEDEGEEGEVWLGVEEERAGAAAAASAARSGGSVAVAAPKPHQMLRLPSLRAALIAAQFVSYRLGVTRLSSSQQLQTELEELPGYVAARVEELRAAIPTWKTLGSLLSGG